MSREKDSDDQVANNVNEEIHAYSAGQEQVEDAMLAQKQKIMMAFEGASVDSAMMHVAGMLPATAPDEGDASPPLWLITFTDIMALMLTFFVMLYSMATPDSEQWKETIQSVEQGIAVQKTLKSSAGEMQEVSIDKIDTQRALDLNYLQSILQQEFEAQPHLNNALLMKGEDRIIIALPMDVVFDSGGVDVKVEAKQALMALSHLFYRVRNRIEVVGHADARPVSGQGDYESNWSLSLARASHVAAVLRQTGYKKDIIVRGVSSGRYDLIDDAAPLDLRDKMARRVDIVIMRDTGAQNTMMPVSMR